jgi:hypothetical protein
MKPSSDTVRCSIVIPNTVPPGSVRKDAGIRVCRIVSAFDRHREAWDATARRSRRAA